MKQIMIAVDFSDQTQEVMSAGLELASMYNAEVLLLHTEEPATAVVHSHVVGPYGGMVGFGVDMPTAKEIIDQQIAHDEEVLTRLKENAELQGLKVRTEVFIGNEVSGIIEKCQLHQPDLLVMGLHKKGFIARLLGENPELALVKRAPCPLLFIPDKTENSC